MVLPDSQTSSHCSSFIGKVSFVIICVDVWKGLRQTIRAEWISKIFFLDFDIECGVWSEECGLMNDQCIVCDLYLILTGRSICSSSSASSPTPPAGTPGSFFCRLPFFLYVFPPSSPPYLPLSPPFPPTFHFFYLPIAFLFLITSSLQRLINTYTAASSALLLLHCGAPHPSLVLPVHLLQLSLDLFYSTYCCPPTNVSLLLFTI